MNIPLNIDFQQILLHLFNFAILAIGLYVLLYKPVKNFMEKRENYYRDMDRQANDKVNKAEELKSAYEAQLANVDAEIREKRAAADKAAEVRASKQLEVARKQAEKVIEDAKQSAELEHRKMVACARQDIVNLAAEAAEKLVRQSLDPSGGGEANEG